MSLALNDEHRQIVRRIVAAHLPGADILVFGSRAKGAAKPYSDLDLALKTREGLSLGELADLAVAFSESDLPLKVDVVDWKAASPILQAIIDRDGIDLNP